jgi:phage regulator Rha-like protein
VKSEQINKLGLPRKIKYYESDTRDSLVIAARLSPEFTARVVDRWQELETKNSLTVFDHDASIHKGALLAFVTSLDKIEQDKPKVAYFDALINRNLLTNVMSLVEEFNH